MSNINEIWWVARMKSYICFTKCTKFVKNFKSKILAYSDFALASCAQKHVCWYSIDFYADNIIGSDN